MPGARAKFGTATWPWFSNHNRRAALNGRHSLAQGLLFFGIPHWFGGPLIDLAAPTQTSTTVPRSSSVNPTYTPTTFNINKMYGGQFSYADTTNLSLTSGPLTVYVSFEQSAALSNGEYLNVFGRFSYTSESVNGGWLIQALPPDDTNKFTFSTFKNNGAATYRHLWVTAPAAGGYSLMATYDGGTNYALYTYGVSNASGGTLLNPVGAAVVGSPLVLGGSSTKIQLYAAGVWNRALSANEIRELAITPTALVRPVREPRATLPAALSLRNTRFFGGAFGGVMNA